MGSLPDRKLDALVAGIEETAAPQSSVKRLVLFIGRDEDDERGKVLVHRTKAVMDPRTERRPVSMDFASRS